jgi:electron transfer flavoprotein alpha subunit
MTVLIIADHDGDTITQPTRSTVTAMGPLGAIHLLLMGEGAEAAAAGAAAILGVEAVLVAAGEANPGVEAMADLVVGMAGDFTHLAAPASSLGKNLMPRVAALLDIQQISEVAGVVDADTFVRPIYAGNALATVKTSDVKKVLTVRAASFDAAPATGGSARIETVAAPAASTLSAFVGREGVKSERPDLTSARIVVSGGRAMGSAENFHMIDSLADRLGAAVGASRAAVDSGYAPNDHQVGQTGKIVAPDLYIAVGISGAIQHLAGMKDSKVIVAINKDEEAPIFQVADYGLVGDLFTLVPELTAELG